MLTYCAINNTNICHAGRDTTAATQGSTIYRMVKPAKLLPHTAHSDWINRTGLTAWAFTDKVAHYSIYRPERMKGWVGLGWLVTYRNKVPPPGVEPGHVTHPSTNRARHRVTSLMRPTLLPLRHAANQVGILSMEQHATRPSTFASEYYEDGHASVLNSFSRFAAAGFVTPCFCYWFMEVLSRLTVPELL